MSPAELYGPWEIEGYQVRVDFTDVPRLRAARNGQDLKALPPAVRASDDMAWLRLTLQAALDHYRSLRDLLENAMVEEIPLPVEDLAMLALDPVGRLLLGRILLEWDGIVGLPVVEDWLWETLTGDLLRLEAPLRVVHPVRLERAGTMAAWDRWLNNRWFRQPFKQIRRETYRPNVDEQVAGCYSARHAKVVVRWDQARAILEGRGWRRVTKMSAERAFARTKLTAHVEFRTPATRGFSREHVMLGRIYFLPTGEQVVNQGRPGLLLERMPPIVFSESLRDVGLVARAAAVLPPDSI
jgi:hypothetical protein